jgi:protein CWC15
LSRRRKRLALYTLCDILTDHVKERERAAQEQEKRVYEIARGNPLLNPQDFNIQRRWDDDVVFKNQARGTEEKRSKEFVNVGIRSSF